MLRHRQVVRRKTPDNDALRGIRWIKNRIKVY